MIQSFLTGFLLTFAIVLSPCPVGPNPMTGGSQTFAVMLDVSNTAGYTDFDYTISAAPAGTTDVVINFSVWANEASYLENTTGSPVTAACQVKPLNHTFFIDQNFIVPPTQNYYVTHPNVPLGAFDGTIDYAGSSGTTIYDSVNVSRRVHLTSPTDVAKFIGTGTKTFTVRVFETDSFSPVTLDANITCILGGSMEIIYQ